MSFRSASTKLHNPHHLRALTAQADHLHIRGSGYDYRPPRQTDLDTRAQPVQAMQTCWLRSAVRQNQALALHQY